MRQARYGQTTSYTSRAPSPELARLPSEDFPPGEAAPEPQPPTPASLVAEAALICHLHLTLHIHTRLRIRIFDPSLIQTPTLQASFRCRARLKAPLQFPIPDDVADGLPCEPGELKLLQLVACIIDSYGLIIRCRYRQPFMYTRSCYYHKPLTSSC
jgi:hypothetical protein